MGLKISSSTLLCIGCAQKPSVTEEALEEIRALQKEIDHGGYPQVQPNQETTPMNDQLSEKCQHKESTRKMCELRMPIRVNLNLADLANAREIRDSADVKKRSVNLVRIVKNSRAS